MNDTLTMRDYSVIKLHNVAANFVAAPKLPFGLSFLIVTKDNEATLDEALTSIEAVANQIIVVDGSLSHKSELICSQHSKVEYWRLFSGEKSWQVFVKSLNFGLEACRFRWVFKWDADMIAEKQITVWRERLMQLNPAYFYEVDVARVNAAKGVEFGGYEGRLFTQHPKVRYSWVPNRDSIVYPLWFKLLRWDERYILHKGLN